MREAAKIGLALGSIVYPASWRVSEDAHRLREWMHGRDGSTPDGIAPGLVPTPAPDGWGLVDGDDHLVFFLSGADQVTSLVVVLFGASSFAIPVDTAGKPSPTQAWRIDWREPHQDCSTTFHQLVADAIDRRAA